MSKSIENLSDDFPGIFKDRGDPFFDDAVIIDVNNPDGVGIDDIFSDLPQESIEGIDAGIFNSDEVLSGLPRERSPGAPISGGRSRIPPIDALAFYIPFHYYPKWWGIYLTVEGLFYLGEQIKLRAPAVPSWVALDFAKVFLYRHEFFHHKIESFATRMECFSRTSCYALGIEDRYQKTKFTKDWLEESLANACALSYTYAAFNKDPYCMKYLDVSMNALIEIVRESDEGYKQGANYNLGDYIFSTLTFEEGTLEICEEYLLACFPHLKSSGLDIWRTANRTLYPISNVKSRTNYIISKHSSIRHRLPLDRLFAKPNNIIKAIRHHGIELKLVPHSGKGSHQKYKVMSGPRSGHAFEIPRKPQSGTIKGIWKQATGESISLTILKAII